MQDIEDGLIQLDGSDQSSWKVKRASDADQPWSIRQATIERIRQRDNGSDRQKSAAELGVSRAESDTDPGGMIQIKPVALHPQPSLPPIDNIDVALQPIMGDVRTFDIVSAGGHDSIHAVAMLEVLTTLEPTPNQTNDEPSGQEVVEPSLHHASIVLLGGVLISARFCLRRGERRSASG